MTNTSSISETAATYGTVVADLQQPLILQQEGQPLAVMVSFEEYQYWRALAADEAQRRLAGWRSLEVLLEEIHRRPSAYTAEQIEVEIGIAQAEVRKRRGMTVVVVIDTSVWVSAFLNPEGFPARLIQAGRTGNFFVVASLPMLDELQEVLERPRIMKIRHSTESEVEAFLAGVAAVVQLVPVSGELQICRDPDDDVILETAIQGNAAYLVSRDEDMTRDLDLISYLNERGIETITVQRLIDRLQLDVA